MTLDVPRRLRMFAGPNGSGKTSLVQKFAKDFAHNGLFRLHHFLNADNLLRNLHEGSGVDLRVLGKPIDVEQIRIALQSGRRIDSAHPFLANMRIVEARLLDPVHDADSYVAASLVDFLREDLFAAGQSFSFETVMSHRSKIDFFARARTAGYRTYLYFVATESLHLSCYRVKERFALGGHDVPEQKIAERYTRCLELVGAAIPHAYRAFLFDNSGTEPVWLAQVTPEGALQLQVPATSLPGWFNRCLAGRFPELAS